MSKWTPIVASALTVLTLPVSVIAAQGNATPSGGAPAQSGQGPNAWRGPKLRVGVMDLTGSAIGQMGPQMAQMGAPMPGAMAMQPGMVAPGQPGMVVPSQPGMIAPGQPGMIAPGQMTAPGGIPGQVGMQPGGSALGGIPAPTSVQTPTLAGVVTSAVGSAITGQQPVTMQQPQPMMQQPQPMMQQQQPMMQPQPMMQQPQAGMMPTSPGAIAPPPQLALGLTEMLTTALTQQNQFIVLERSKVDQVLNEQNFGASGRVDPTSAAQVGKVLGAQVLIFGDITEYSEHQSSVGGGFNVLKNLTGQVAGSVSRVTAQLAMDLRLVDAASGQVIASVRGEGKASATGITANFQAADQNFGAGGTAQTPLGQASRSAIANAVAGIIQGMQKVPWSGRVVDVRGPQIYINAGATQGVATGMIFDIYSQGEQLIDPETHLALGTPDQRVGGVTIVSVAPQYSVGQVTDGTGMKRNDVVRFKGSGNAP